jgi:hypothetical protein
MTATRSLHVHTTQHGASNWPHEFEQCPKCGKKGVYERRMPILRYTREKRCKYCQETVERR